MSVIDQAVAHFEGLGRQSLAVPEWGTGDASLMVYWTPLTIAEHRKVFRPGRDDGIAAYVDLLILKAEDADGGKLFRASDDMRLRTRVDRTVLSRVATAILLGLSSKDAEKNSDPIPAG